jgi:hypothetical protein
MPSFGLLDKRSTRLWIGSAVILLFLAAYPKPALFTRTLERALHPPIDPVAMAEISRSLPDDPAKIEAWVIGHIQRDANDYANWGVIFYIASPAEVLSIGRGPCYGRAIVLASILERKGIPYQLYMMPGHIWVDYAQRVPTIWPEFEKREYAVWRWDGGHWYYNGWGWLRILPRAMLIQFQLYWRITPLISKIIVFIAVVGIVGLMLQRRQIARSVESGKSFRP